MWTIRRPKLSKLPISNGDAGVVLRTNVRGLLMNLRLLHHWQSLMRQAYEAMPEQARPPYQAFAEMRIHPDVQGVLMMIKQARADGHLSATEAMDLIEGRHIDILRPATEDQQNTSTRPGEAPQ